MGAGPLQIYSSPEGGEDIIVIDRSRRRYKRCVIHEDRLIGTVMIGDSAGFADLRSLISSGTGRRVSVSVRAPPQTPWRSQPVDEA